MPRTTGYRKKMNIKTKSNCIQVCISSRVQIDHYSAYRFLFFQGPSKFFSSLFCSLARRNLFPDPEPDLELSSNTLQTQLGPFHAPDQTAPMERPGLSPAKAVLLAVQLAHSVNIPALRTLVARNPKILNTELILRIVLTHLPESLDSSEYVGFVQELVEGTIEDVPDQLVDSSVLEGLNEKEATKKVRKLHLLPLAWPGAPPDVPADILTPFLIHRSLRIDEATGLIKQVPALVTPFLDRSSYLRTWFISTILPLIRFNYEYHPQDTATISISAFERLDDEAGIRLLLSRTQAAEGDDAAIGRDLRGLIGPWMYGNNRSKRRKLRSTSSFSAQTIAPLNEAPVVNERCASWEEVFKWVSGQATTSWRTAVQVVEQWDGPGDVDLGGYGEGSIFLEEDDQRHLERRYARSALAAAYLIPEASVKALEGVQKILLRIIGLLDLERIPTLEVAGALLSPVTGLTNNILSPKNATFLRNGLLDEDNVLTTPNKESLKLLHALLISSYLFTRERRDLSIGKAAQMVFAQDEHQQRVEFISIMAFGSTRSPHKGEDKYWAKLRNEVLWMRSLGGEEIGEGTDSSIVAGRGILGKLSKEYIEVEILKGLLANSRMTPLIKQRTLLISTFRLCPCEINIRKFASATDILEDTPGYDHLFSNGGL